MARLPTRRVSELPPAASQFGEQIVEGIFGLVSQGQRDESVLAVSRVGEAVVEISGDDVRFLAHARLAMSVVAK